MREKLTGGISNLKKMHSKQIYLGGIFDLGVHEGDTILIWGYADGFNPNLEVRVYQKVENPWVGYIVFMIISKPNCSWFVFNDN